MTIRLEIKAQPRLTWAKQVEVCLDGIQHRLLRSTITLMVITLAIAFFVNVCVEWAVTSKLRRAVGDLRERDSRLDRFVSVATTTLSPLELQQWIAAFPDAEPTADQEVLRGWISQGAPSDQAASDWSKLQVFSSRSAALERWFGRLPAGYRRLLGGAGTGDLRGLLADAGGRQRFASAAARYDQFQKPVWLDDYVGGYAQNQSLAQSAADKVNRGVDRLNAFLAGASGAATTPSSSPSAAQALVRLLASPTDIGDKLKDLIPPISASSLQELAEQAALRRQTQALIAVLRLQPVQRAWSQRFGATMDQAGAVAALAHDPAAAAWLAGRPELLASTKPDADGVRLDEVEIARLAGALDRRNAADQLWERFGADAADGTSSVLWLLSVSMLVCVVGVTNAMLVSVLERFREIATIKCLGGLDSFIATLFIMEAGLLGLAGGTLGVVLGGLVGLSRMTASFGTWTWRYFPAGQLVLICLAAVVLGWLLTTLAAIYPSIKAAMMPPMEAMRVA